jgi:signal transduction histidine kinase
VSLLVAPGSRDELAVLLSRVRQGVAVEHYETVRMRKDGSLVDVALTVSPIRDAAGRVVGASTIARDITERRLAETLVRRLNAELEERVLARTAELEAFVYSISHDLRAPLRAIDGFSEMVLEDAGEKLSADDLAHLRRVRAGAQRMALLIDALLGLSRASRGDLQIEDIDVSASAASIIRELRAIEPERHVETVVRPGVHADADATLVRAVLSNLIGNAWKFTGKHETARIEVGVTDSGGARAFFVRDDGVGFDMAHAKLLFGPFQRLHPAEQFEGTGIGLATVQRLVARHGGRVWAEAEVDKGATFFFTLPEPSATA